MRRSATIAALAVLVTASLTGCADLTTTGVEAGDDGSAMQSGHDGPTDLAGTSWVLTSSSATDDIGARTITADFSAEQISGQAPVNTYRADYTLTGSQVEFGQIATTMKAGSEADMRAEGAYLGLLASADHIQIDGTELVLLAGETPVLTYEGVHMSQPGQIEEFADTLVGKPVAEAEAAAVAAGYAFRVISKDGQSLPATSDYRTDRINAAVEGGTVTSVSIG